MNDLGIIDRLLDVFSRFIDSGFGLLGGEVAFLSAALVAIDITLAGLLWAMGGTDDVMMRLVKKTLYVGAFAFILGNFNALSSILFRSFAQLGLVASGSPLPPAQLLQPGRIASVGVDAARPILTQIGNMTGFPTVFLNLDSIVVLFIAWLIVLVSFFVLAVQLFVTLLEFKLTTLAGFILVPFALWNRTAFLAERVLGNVVSSGVKVLILAVIIGIGSTIFAQFGNAVGAEPSLDQTLAVVLAALALLGLGMFGPGIATGLISGGPQLGAGAAAGAAIGATGLAIGAGAAVAGGARVVARGAAALRSGTTRGSSVAGAATAAQSSRQSTQAASRMGDTAKASNDVAPNAQTPSAAATENAPAWAQRLQRRRTLVHGASTAAHVLRATDHGGGGASPRLHDGEGQG